MNDSSLIKEETAVTTLENSNSIIANVENIQYSDAPDTFVVTPVSLDESKYYLVLKRMFDIICSFLGILVLSPLLIILAIIIKMEDRKASIFFAQDRVGLNGKRFRMYKFRSMVSDAEERLGNLLEHNEIVGAMFKMSNDPRVTKVGRFIRKTSLDELPQLWNVLLGDMSLVGPRPPLPREVAEYTSYDLQRLSVTPGCTGLWQVSGRSNIGFKEMVDLDILYIKSRTFMMDLKIIMKTIGVMVGSKDAY